VTKMLLNTGSTVLHTNTGAPVPPGGIVTDDEMDAHEALMDDGVLVHVRPSELPDDAENLSDAAREHASGNAAPAVGDDAGVKQSPSKGGKS
jgi:hypothetical protein